LNALITFVTPFIDNWNYFGVMVDGTYRLDTSGHVLFVLAILTPCRKTRVIGYCLAKSENNIVVSRFVLKFMEILIEKTNKKPKKLYIIDDLTSFIDKAVEEAIKPELLSKDIEVERLICKVHFEGVRKKIISNQNLSVSIKTDRDEEKKILNSFVKLLVYSPSEKIFKSIVQSFKTYTETKHKEVFEKFEVYTNQYTGYSLFRRPVRIPFDNNPLEGINNGIKTQVTNFVKKNVGVLMKDLEADLKNKVNLITQGVRLIFDTKLLIPHNFWQFARYFSEICQSLIQDVTKPPNKHIKTIYIGDQYCFQTFLDRNDKTKTASEFKVKDKLVKIGIEDDKETIKEFFKSELFYQPTKQEIKLYNEPEKAKSLSQCFTLIALKEVQVDNSLDDSKCSCSDFKLVGFCIHVVGLLLYFKRISLPLALQAPGNLINLIFFNLYVSEERKT